MAAYVSVHLGGKNKEREEKVLVDCFKDKNNPTFSEIQVALNIATPMEESRARIMINDLIAYGVIYRCTDLEDAYAVTDTGKRLVKEIIRERHFEKELEEEKYSELFNIDVEEEQTKDHKE